MFDILFIDFPLAVAAAIGLIIACVMIQAAREGELGSLFDSSTSTSADDLADQIQEIRHERGLS